MSLPDDDREELETVLDRSIEEREKLRELNSEMLAALKDVLSNGITHPEAFQKAAALIAKAEALK